MFLKGRKFPGSFRSSCQGKGSLCGDGYPSYQGPSICRHAWLQSQRLAGVEQGCERHDPSWGARSQDSTEWPRVISFIWWICQTGQKVKMKLLVELKPHGGEPANYVDLFVQKMRDLGSKKIIRPCLWICRSWKRSRKSPWDQDRLCHSHSIRSLWKGFGRLLCDWRLFLSGGFGDTSPWDEKRAHVWTINNKQKLTKYLQQPIDGDYGWIDRGAKTEKDLKQNKSYFDRFLNLVATSKEE